ncbi:triacylglycerol lipase OBL1-like [Lycium ferocissimum]|uniref:triacylglycerol lipase OBL1-like n=1 Tax=Lycium ferocissimum TaxID=112874 RepID=UPI0028151F01|nr:triacylglycerol lipase OBL1-like [Lycium ferocissimum]
MERVSSKKYLQLKPDEASLFDLIRVLFSGNLGSKQFIESLRVKEIALERRGYIFLSMSVQKALHFFSKLLSILGSISEFCLNLLASNQSLPTLLLRILQGKVVMPDKESANYLSAIGFIDTRVNCHKKFKPEDKTYIVALSAVASKVAYENKAFIRATVEDQWKMELLGEGAYDFWNEYHQKKSTQGFIFHDNTTCPDRIIVAFRGTEPFNSDDWSTDFDISWYDFQNMGKVHSGFMKALGLQKDKSWPLNIPQDNQHPVAYYTIREKLRDFFQKNNQTKFILTGHSLGGALAILFAAVLASHNESFILERLEAIYTFGQPRVGDAEFGDFMKENFRNYGIGYYRFVYSHDIVPRLPYDNTTLCFKHFGTCLYYSSIYEGKIVSEEPYRNYFSLRSLISKRVDALWELVRSFLLPYLYGTEYKESLLLQALRLYGLLFPGMPAHGPPEYINAICLGDATLLINVHK